MKVWISFSVTDTRGAAYGREPSCEDVHRFIMGTEADQSTR
jgi:hypothetical protein